MSIINNRTEKYVSVDINDSAWSHVIFCDLDDFPPSSRTTYMVTRARVIDITEKFVVLADERYATSGLLDESTRLQYWEKENCKFCYFEVGLLYSAPKFS